MQFPIRHPASRTSDQSALGQGTIFGVSHSSALMDYIATVYRPIDIYLLMALYILLYHEIHQVWRWYRHALNSPNELYYLCKENLSKEAWVAFIYIRVVSRCIRTSRMWLRHIATVKEWARAARSIKDQTLVSGALFTWDPEAKSLLRFACASVPRILLILDFSLPTHLIV